LLLASPEIRYPASGIRHPASGIRHPASGIQHPASGIARAVYCARLLARAFARGALLVS